MKLPLELVKHNWQDTSIYDANGNQVCTFSLDEDDVTEESQEEMETHQKAEADFIIHAVNCYDEMLEALEYVMNSIESQDDYLRDRIPHSAKLIEAAIAKAKGL